jgi:hypothetical protein
MITKIVEVTNNFNWGKFMLAAFDEQEWKIRSQLTDSYLLGRLGWDRSHVWFMDLQTGEACFILPGGMVARDLEKHAVWVCPMAEPFLEWFYAHKEYHRDIIRIPNLVLLTDAESSFRGYRRQGPSPEEKERVKKETAINNQIFVFGSNREGRHGKGAAKMAMLNHGAIYGQAEGLQGDSYAIITKELRSDKPPVTVSEIADGVRRFLIFAAKWQATEFNVTPIGCGLAGFTPAVIAPMFKDAPSNVLLPSEFDEVLKNG